MKKVTFIGGSSYSGSTVLDLMLSNDTGAFSCGELYALFRPTLPHHINPRCGCGNQSCHIWSNIKKLGEKHVYQNLFNLYPNVEMLVDSSKSPIWLLDQIHNLSNHEIQIYNFLIWKSPEEYAFSCFKRNRLKYWAKSWINYYLRYFSTIDNWKTIPYRLLATDPISTLKFIGDITGQTYFNGKECFWEKQHHTLFGNASAKIHLHEEYSENYDKHVNHINEHQLNVKIPQSKASFRHRTIYYDNPDYNVLPKFVREEIYNNNSFKEIIHFLEKTDIRNSTVSKDIFLSAKSYSKNKPFPLWYNIDKIRSYYQQFVQHVNSKNTNNEL